MKKDPEKAVCDIYRAYQCMRIDQENITDRTANETVDRFESEVFDQNEEQIISLYNQFQRNRNSNREIVIDNVLSIARSYTAQQSKNTNTELEYHGTKPKNRVSLWHKLQLWFRSGSMGGWQSAAVFSVTIAFISVISIQFHSQDANQLDQVAGIPNFLYEHAIEVVPYIQPHLDNQFGFSSSQEPQRAAFRAGVLLVQLQMLVKANELVKLQKTLVTATLFLRRTNKAELIQPLNRLVANIKASKGRENRIYYINSFEASVQGHFTNLGVYPLLEFGKWVEISLLSSQLSESSRFTLLNQLLPQGREIANQTNAHLSDEPAVLTLIDDTLKKGGNTVISAQDMVDLHKKLEKIKAALLL